MTVARRLAAVFGLLALAAAAVSPVVAANAGVNIVGTTFEPATITVAPGDTVTWTVEGAITDQHSVTSGTTADPGKVFDSGVTLKATGDTYAFTFAAAGDYPYFCSIHPTTMTGKVVVQAAGQGHPPTGEVGIPVERRALAGGILVISIVLMFAGAWLWRRMNPA